LEVYVKPEVALGDYKGIKAQKRVTPINDADVDAEIERVRESVSTYTDITDRPVQLGDQVTMDYDITIDGELVEDGSFEEYTLVIGSGELLPEFEDQLIGAEILQEQDVNVTFPDDYSDEALRGKPALIKATVTAIHEKEMPELDDEFAKDVSEYETFGEYAAQTREKMESAARESDLAEFKSHVIDAAVSNARIDIPPAMIEDRIDKLLEDYKFRLNYRGIKMETYLRVTEQEIDDIRDELREDAEYDVRARLVIEAIGEAEQIEPAEDDIDAQITKYVDRIHIDIEKFKDSMTEEDSSYFKNLAKNEKIVSFLADSAIPIEITEVQE
jgi:trigger factor